MIARNEMNVLEEMFLLCLIFDFGNEYIKDALLKFKREWLTKEVNRITLDAIIKTYDEYGKVDLVLLKEKLCFDIILNLLDIEEMFSVFPHTYKHYMKAIKKRYIERKKNQILGERGEVSEIVDALQKLDTTLDNTESFDSIAMKEIKKIEDKQGGSPEFRTGVFYLDKMIGMERGDLVVIGADTGTGKSSLALSIAHLMSYNKRILINDKEMGESGVIKRLIKGISSIDVFSPNVYKLTNEEIKRVKSVEEDMKGLDIHICNSSTASNLLEHISEISPDIVIIDYIQLMSASSFKGNRAQEIGELARAFKNMAVQTNTLFVVVSQLARGSVDKNKLPTIHTLKESGDIEGSSDVILLLYRKWLYDNTAEKFLVNCFVGKNRNGEIGSVKLFFNTKRMQMKGWIEEESEF